jgi:nucleotide-binding universal stress UspA family protein
MDARSSFQRSITMYKRILVPVDGSETSGQALAAALQLAQLKGGCVRLVYVLEEVSHVNGYALHLAHDHARKVLDAASATAKAAGVDCDERLVDVPGSRLGEIVSEEARSWEADLVVVGTHGRRGVGRALLGSGAEQVIRLAPVPVLTIRGPAAANPV